MAATAAQIAQLRRMVGEPGTDTYSDADLTAYIERYACLDAQGEEPAVLDVSTTPPSYQANLDWIPTYDLAAAAADVWAEKAATWAARYDFNLDGQDHSRSQAYEQMMKQSRYWRARRRPGIVRAHVWPHPGMPTAWLGNAAEPS